MSRIVLLTLACSAALAAAQYSNADISSSPSPNERSKRQSHHHHSSRHSSDEDPFVGPEEGRENNRRHNGDTRRDSDSNSLEDFDTNGPRFPGPVFPGPVFPQGPVVVQNPMMPMGSGPVVVQNPSMVPVDPIPPAEPIILPVAAEEGHGLVVEDEIIPPLLPQPEFQHGDFRPSPMRPSGPNERFTTTTTTTTTPSPRGQSPGGFFPSLTLTCSSVRCPSGATCRMENNRRTGRGEPVCVFTGANSPSSCNQVRCSAGFECEMQQSSSCSSRQCPFNPVCIQSQVTTTPPAPIVSCDTVRCSSGTVCRIQTVDHCTFAPCAMQAVCVSPCASVSCPTNSQCRVDERSLATSCVPNVPAESPPSSACAGVRCGFGQRCAVVKNCSWSRECRDEARCINF